MAEFFISSWKPCNYSIDFVYRGKRLDNGEMVEGGYTYRSRDKVAQHIIVVQEGLGYVHHPVNGMSVETKNEFGAWVSLYNTKNGTVKKTRD